MAAAEPQQSAVGLGPTEGGGSSPVPAPSGTRPPPSPRSGGLESLDVGDETLPLGEGVGPSIPSRPSQALKHRMPEALSSEEVLSSSIPLLLTHLVSTASAPADGAVCARYGAPTAGTPVPGTVVPISHPLVSTAPAPAGGAVRARRGIPTSRVSTLGTVDPVGHLDGLGPSGSLCGPGPRPDLLGGVRAPVAPDWRAPAAPGCGRHSQQPSSRLRLPHPPNIPTPASLPRPSFLPAPFIPPPLAPRHPAPQGRARPTLAAPDPTGNK